MNQHLREKLLRRKAAAKYLSEVRGLQIAPQTLAKYACSGFGPTFQKWGRHPLYRREDLDVWADARLGPPQRSTSDVPEARLPDVSTTELIKPEAEHQMPAPSSASDRVTTELAASADLEASLTQIEHDLLLRTCRLFTAPPLCVSLPTSWSRRISDKMSENVAPAGRPASHNSWPSA